MTLLLNSQKYQNHSNETLEQLQMFSKSQWLDEVYVKVTGDWLCPRSSTLIASGKGVLSFNATLRSAVIKTTLYTLWQPIAVDVWPLLDTNAKFEGTMTDNLKKIAIEQS